MRVIPTEAIEALEAGRRDEAAFARFSDRIDARLAVVRERLARADLDQTALLAADPASDQGLEAQAVFLRDSGLLEGPSLGRDPLTAARDYLLRLDGPGTRPAPYFLPELYDQLDPDRDAPRPGLDPFVRFLLRALAHRTPPDRFCYRYALWDQDTARKHYPAEQAALSALPHFDRDHYRAQAPTVDWKTTDPVEHYTLEGWRLGLSPHPDFDPAAHAAAHPLLFRHKINPFLHWLTTRPLAQAPDPAPAPVHAPSAPERRPRVSVIVPCYNHARYLPERLDSIYGQTFDDFEVILLDDASTDGSAAILADYAARSPDRTRLVTNPVNSGGVFRQWRAGLARARGTLCWIAESDDRCAPDFLAKLVPAFDDETVLLAHARCRFVDADGLETGFTLDDHLEPVGAATWRESFVRSALAEVRDGLGVCNTIPNVSAAVFRNPAGLPLLDDPDWLSMRICGDWLFYLHLLAGGRIAFRADAGSEFRLDADSAGAKSYDDPAYYREHEAVARAVARLYKVDAPLLRRHRELVARFHASRRPASVPDLDALYDPAVEGFLEAPRTPTVLISLFAFSLGGGEIWPLRLANALKAAGLTVAVHNLDSVPAEPAVRVRLRPNIPVWTASNPDDFLEVLAGCAPDVVNTHHHATQSLVRAARHLRPTALAGTVHVASMHGMYEAMSEAALDAELPALCASADYWTYVADKNIVPFRARGFYDPAVYIKFPYGLEPPEPGGPSRSELGLPEDAFVVCLASRALESKGWREAVWSVDLARELSGVDIHLLLLGEGPLYDEFLCLPLPDHIHLLGLVRDSGLYYAISDLGLLPTRFAGESMPLTVMEALARGKPVLATPVGEVPAMLGPEPLAGAFIPLRNGDIDVSGLARSLVAFATDPERLARAGMAARERADRYDITAVAGRFIELFCR
jgi:glycosyltransferase involved in cell wall biosynthesis